MPSRRPSVLRTSVVWACMPPVWLCAMVMLTAAPALAQQDKAAERAQRRAQLQLKALQDQLQESQAARAKADGERAELQKQQQQGNATLARAVAAERKLTADLKASQDDRAALLARIDDLEKRFAAAKASSEESLAARGREVAKANQLARQLETDEVRLQSRLADQQRLVLDCSDKNRRLADLSIELMERFRQKGFIDVLRQREPVLGLGEGRMFDLIQEYRDRAEADRITVGGGR